MVSLASQATCVLQGGKIESQVLQPNPASSLLPHQMNHQQSELRLMQTRQMTQVMQMTLQLQNLQLQSRASVDA